jgi:hypothetical protein
MVPSKRDRTRQANRPTSWVGNKSEALPIAHVARRVITHRNHFSSLETVKISHVRTCRAVFSGTPLARNPAGFASRRGFFVALDQALRWVHSDERGEAAYCVLCCDNFNKRAGSKIVISPLE